MHSPIIMLFGELKSFFMFERVIKSSITNKIGKGKAIVLIGPRQVCKTTLLNSILKDKTHLFLNDEIQQLGIYFKMPTQNS